jgi:uncharacterized membrane-anchored protein
MRSLYGPFALVTALAALLPCTATARAAEPASSDSAAPSEKASPDSAKRAPLHLNWKSGPQALDLGHDVSLALPEGDAFVDGNDAAKALERNGSFHNEDVVGLVVGKSPDAKWFVVIRYEDAGYIKDSKSIDAGELLKSLKEGTEEANKERKSRGFAPFHVQGWSEPPRYDRSIHQLVWALTVKGDDDDRESVNYNTRVLGRRGVVSLNLVCDPRDLTQDRPQVATLLAGTSFKSGQRYEDFNAKTDKVAEYGLAGLVLGGMGLGAVKLLKIGLIAKFWKVILAALIAGKKAVVLLFAGAAAYGRRLFGRKKTPTPTAPTPPPQASA